MKLKLLREPSGADTTFGILLVDGFLECWTLENSNKIIPPGTYGIAKYYSPNNKREVPLLTGIMDRSFIEIHPANYYYELEGCIALGRDISRPMLVNSVIAFEVLFKKLDFNNLTIQIEYL